MEIIDFYIVCIYPSEVKNPSAGEPNGVGTSESHVGLISVIMMLNFYLTHISEEGFIWANEHYKEMVLFLLSTYQ